MKDEQLKPVGRPEKADLAIVEHTLGRLIGIRYCMAAMTARLRNAMREDDWTEANQILDLANAIQDDYLRLHALVSTQTRPQE